MKKLIAVTVTCAVLPNLALADQPTVKPTPSYGTHGAFVGNDAGSDSDFDSSFRIEGFGLLNFSANLAAEAGLAYSTATEDSASDNTGSYSLEIDSSDLFAGVRLESSRIGRFTLYGRGGLLYYHSTINFREDFFGFKPGGKLEDVEEGTGYYLEGGAAFHFDQHFKLDAGITYRVRQDYYSDSSRPFDMTEAGLGIGLVYTP